MDPVPRGDSRGSPHPRRPTQATAGFTGKYLVLLRDDGIKEGLDAIRNASGLRTVASASDYAGAAVDMANAARAEVLVLDELKVAVVHADPTQVIGLRRRGQRHPGRGTGADHVCAHHPNPVESGHAPWEYLRGYRDAVNHVYGSLTGVPVDAVLAGETARFTDTAQFAWGLQATRVAQSRFSGKEVRVAVLDTGFDLDHPDFVGRVVVSESFILGQPVNDLHGHGTHCVGTALGPQQPAGAVRRYGCAFRGEIFVGKVLSNQGSGADGGILAGINWAIANGCRVISMSLGAFVAPGEPFSRIYEDVARRALRSTPGTLIVAAAGNDSCIPGTNQRMEPPQPVSRPANCPSIMAVAAVDADLGIAAFSNGGISPEGGGVDIAGPGVAAFSSVPDPFPLSVQPSGPGRPWPPRYHTISGRAWRRRTWLAWPPCGWKRAQAPPQKPSGSCSPATRAGSSCRAATWAPDSVRRPSSGPSHGSVGWPDPLTRLVGVDPRFEGTKGSAGTATGRIRR